MFYGYNTNGLAHHSLSDAARLLAEIGYQGIAVTLDHDLLERRGHDFFWRTEPEVIRETIHQNGLRSVIETGARFLLNPWKKHSPTLLDPDADARRFRQNYYFRAVELAEKLGSDCVSIWSGSRISGKTVLKAERKTEKESESEPEKETVLFTRLASELRILVDYAGEHGVKIALEPEPGMMIDTIAQFERLLDSAPSELCLTVDVGHLFCQYEPISESIFRHAPRLVNIHFEDSVRGVHEHLFPGDGEIPYDEFFTALREIAYSGGVFAELSRHSHQGVETAMKAFSFLKKYKHPLLREVSSVSEAEESGGRLLKPY
ncbi:MAG: sugar phosphate isomerase/epimerase [Planctomycetia bacterium]|nr:sugar phosphate isomerase/epimerase [Planctomycetia bacterium]